MHESRLVGLLLDEAGRQAEPSQIVGMTLRIGALAAVTADGLQHGIAARAHELWGTTPRIQVEHGTDPTEPTAQGVVLVSLQIEGD